MARKVFSTHIRKLAKKDSPIRCNPPKQWSNRDSLPSIAPSEIKSFKPKQVKVKVPGKGKGAEPRTVLMYTSLCGRCLTQYGKEQEREGKAAKPVKAVKTAKGKRK